VKGIRALLLDLDGTVADTHEIIYQCLNETAQEHLAADFPRGLWEQHVGTPLADLFALVRSPTASAFPSIEELISSYRSRQARHEDRLRAFPGMTSVLAELRARDVRLAIVTTKLQAIARRHLAAIGLLECFDAIVGFDDCVRAKPDAEPFHLALRALDVAPLAAAGVGDSPVDIHGARAAGVLAVGALWGTVSRSALLAAQPDHIANAPVDLLQLVE
jgi:HAD superfamily hydrolase (TIGR01509 family)